jgi:ribonuclease R
MHAMVGNRSGETYRLGDRVTVRLVEAAPVAGALRFEVLSEGRRVRDAGPQRHVRSRPERAQRPGRPSVSNRQSRRKGGKRGR